MGDALAQPCFKCGDPISRAKGSELRGLGKMCETCWPKKIPGGHSAKCPRGFGCEVAHARKIGYKTTSKYFEHLLACAQDAMHRNEHRDASYQAVLHVIAELKSAAEADVQNLNEASAPAMASADERRANASDYEAPAGPRAPPAAEAAPVENLFWIWSIADRAAIFANLRQNVGETSTFQSHLMTRLRENVTNIAEDVFKARAGVDIYTACDRDQLLALDEDYLGNIEYLINRDHPAFVSRGPRDDRRFYEVDHVIDVQIWSRAIMIANSRAGENVGEESPSLSFRQLLYLHGSINNPLNLNVTTWSVNAIAKNNLVKKFLELWDFNDDEGATFRHSAANIIVTELRGKTNAILLKELEVIDGATEVHTRVAHGVLCCTLIFMIL